MMLSQELPCQQPTVAKRFEQDFFELVQASFGYAKDRMNGGQRM